ncbi:MAG: type I-E CRISPR-associated protein Cse1/CasA [Dissulfuribacterales bacterium]
MNLLTEKWLGITRRDGTNEKIAPWQITENFEKNPIVDVVSPRPDFRGAIVQFLIGLLQTTCTPETTDDWEDWWPNGPAPDTLKQKFDEYVPYFNLTGNAPLFMQDFNTLEDEKPKSVSALLIDAPGGKTVKDNLDHFVKRGHVNAICPYCAALSLFTLQANAPAGGVGHRVGLRGGGPLTTLVMPDNSTGDQTLWKLLWLNVLSKEELGSLSEKYKQTSDLADIFPWAGQTRTSEKKTGQDTLPANAHLFQMYWGMPRRIRLDFENPGFGNCDLCGDTSEKLISQFRMKNYGMNYSGEWEHPLSPHRFDNRMPIPLHPQKGGISYRHWLGLTLGDESENQKPALVVQKYLHERSDLVAGNLQARIWVFGYDMDNMKARCWYDSLMPIENIPEKYMDAFYKNAGLFIDTSKKIAGNVRSELKKAWFTRPADHKGDFSFVDTAFWQNTENAFYDSIKELLECLKNGKELDQTMKKWHGALRKNAMEIFDQWALSGPIEDMQMKRVVEARKNLSVWIETEKHSKQLKGII